MDTIGENRPPIKKRENFIESLAKILEVSGLSVGEKDGAGGRNRTDTEPGPTGF